MKRTKRKARNGRIQRQTERQRRSSMNLRKRHTNGDNIEERGRVRGGDKERPKEKKEGQEIRCHSKRDTGGDREAGGDEEKERQTQRKRRSS